MNLLNAIKTLIQIYHIKTLYFNLKAFPLKTAIHLPVLFYGRCQVAFNGGVELKVKPRLGVLIIGRNQSQTYGLEESHYNVTYIKLNGVLEICGYNNKIANGCKIYIKKGGRLILKGNNLLQNNSKIHCAHSIVIGYYSQISWETQIFDTNMHYLIDFNGKIKNNKGTIVIGNFCWIGNRTTIQKGAKLPDYMVVASNSIVNKDFTNQPYGVIAGIPAKCISIGSRRLLDYNIERKTDKFFEQNPDIDTVQVSDL